MWVMGASVKRAVGRRRGARQLVLGGGLRVGERGRRGWHHVHDRSVPHAVGLHEVGLWRHVQRPGRVRHEDGPGGGVQQVLVDAARDEVVGRDPLLGLGERHPRAVPAATDRLAADDGTEGPADGLDEGGDDDEAVHDQGAAVVALLVLQQLMVQGDPDGGQCQHDQRQSRRHCRQQQEQRDAAVRLEAGRRDAAHSGGDEAGAAPEARAGPIAPRPGEDGDDGQHGHDKAHQHFDDADDEGLLVVEARAGAKARGRGSLLALAVTTTPPTAATSATRRHDCYRRRPSVTPNSPRRRHFTDG